MRVALSGCSGGGKSTLLDALARRGLATVAEPGRRIIAAGPPEDAPWASTERFTARALAMAAKDWQQADPNRVTLFDRSTLDAATALARQGPLPDAVIRLLQVQPYHSTVFLTPPWPEIFVQDADRRHDVPTALEEYTALCHWLPRWGYTLSEIPRLPVEARADWLLSRLPPLA